MKNYFKIITVLVLSVLLLGSCTMRIGDPNDPFIVDEITQDGSEGFSIYTSGGNSLAMPSGLWRISDTVDFRYLYAEPFARKAYDVIVRPKYNVTVFADTAVSGLNEPFLRIDSLLLPEGLAVQYVKESNTLTLGYDTNKLFGIKQE